MTEKERRYIISTLVANAARRNGFCCEHEAIDYLRDVIKERGLEPLLTCFYEGMPIESDYDKDGYVDGAYIIILFCDGEHFATVGGFRKGKCTYSNYGLTIQEEKLIRQIYWRKMDNALPFLKREIEKNEEPAEDGSLPTLHKSIVRIMGKHGVYDADLKFDDPELRKFVEDCKKEWEATKNE